MSEAPPSSSTESVKPESVESESVKPESVEPAEPAKPVEPAGPSKEESPKKTERSLREEEQQADQAGKRTAPDGPARRPRGLGGEKRQKTIEPSAPPSGNAEGRALMFELPENATQFDELNVMLQTAEACLDDAEKALPLLRGIIHECDAIVRSHKEDSAPERDTDMPLDAAFYALYGDALFFLGQVEYREDAPEVIEFLREAVDRYETGLACEPRTPAISKHLLERRAVSLALHYAQQEDSEAEGLVSWPDCQRAYRELVEASRESLHFELLELVRTLEEAAQECNDCARMRQILDFALSLHGELLGESVEDDAVVLHGRLVNLLAEARLEPIVESERESLSEGDRRELGEIDELLVGSAGRLAGRPKGNALVQLGEALLLRGSVLELEERGEEANAVYREARDAFREAQETHGVVLGQSVRDFMEEAH